MKTNSEPRGKTVDFLKPPNIGIIKQCIFKDVNIMFAHKFSVVPDTESNPLRQYQDMFLWIFSPDFEGH